MFNKGSLKKLVFGLIIVFVILISYFYQRPIMSTGEAVIKVEAVLQNSPKEWNKSFSQFSLSDVKPEDIRAVLNKRRGFFNEITNQQQWEITIKYNHKIRTVILNAYTGKLIEMQGLLN